MKKTYAVKAKVWLYPGNPSASSGQVSAWRFVTLPQKDAKDIDFYFHHAKRGWGSLPVVVTTGKTSWKTSIFPDKQSASYLLPLKAEVRKKEAIREGDTIRFSLQITG